MDKDPDAIRADIEATRERLGDTVDAISYKADVPSRVRDSIDERSEAVQSTIAGGVKAVKERLSDATDSIRGKLSDASDAVSSRASDAAGSVSSRASDTLDSVSSNLPSSRQLRRGLENPLGLAIGALAAGFIGGLLIPVSRIEQDRLEPVADNLTSRAGELRDDLVDRGKQVINETVAAATTATTAAMSDLGSNGGASSTASPGNGSSRLESYSGSDGGAGSTTFEAPPARENDPLPIYRSTHEAG